MWHPTTTGHEDGTDDLILVYFSGCRFLGMRGRTSPSRYGFAGASRYQTWGVELLHEEDSNIGFAGSGFDQGSRRRMDELVSQAANERILGSCQKARKRGFRSAWVRWKESSVSGRNMLLLCCRRKAHPPLPRC